MIEISGKHNTAKVFTDTLLDDHSREQIEMLCDQRFTEGSAIRMMPDVHAGAGCTIGTTMTITDKIVPNLVGVDIGCGMETVRLRAESACSRGFEPARLDELIHREIPSGRDTRDAPHAFNSEIDLSAIRCPAIHPTRARVSLGTLGGGNHFIEADRDNVGNLYFVIHSGSRHLGLEVANWYQDEAWNQLNHTRKDDIYAHIKELKAAGRQKEIQGLLKTMKTRVLTDVPRVLAYVSGALFDDYINDMRVVQRFAALNRKAMMDVMLRGLGVAESEIAERWTTIHNYIDTDSSPFILRKGAVSARRGEKLLIPLNMRDGSLVCEGLGNADWNFSAPHGAGRVMSRGKAFATLSLDEYTREMAGIYSTCVSAETLDESPMAYKTMDAITANITPTARVLAVIKPVYNFKAAE
jgi:RNA-splicing ligase RtcB